MRKNITSRLKRYEIICCLPEVADKNSGPNGFALSPHDAIERFLNYLLWPNHNHIIEKITDGPNSTFYKVYSNTDSNHVFGNYVVREIDFNSQLLINF